MDLDKRRLLVILATLFLTIGGTFVASVYALGWPAATLLTAVSAGMIAVHGLRSGDRFTGLLGIIGLVAGFAELASDYWAIDRFHALFYPANEPMIWRSPLYMPFAWAVIVVQLSVIGRRLGARFSLPAAMGLTGIIGGVNIPLYEHLAKDANLWHYENCRMAFESTPYFIIIYEVLLSIPLPWIALWVEKRGVTAAALTGLALGAWMWAALLLGWTVAEPLP